MKKKSCLLIVLCLLMSMMLTACGGSSGRSGAKSLNSASYGGSYNSYQDSMDYDMAEEACAPSPSENGKATIEASRKQVKLIYNGNLSFETVCCLYHQKKDFISVPYEPKDAEYLKK